MLLQHILYLLLYIVYNNCIDYTKYYLLYYYNYMLILTYLNNSCLHNYYVNTTDR